ncbi:MAG: NlpC/P60 family protein [Actinomycetes bacterium]
MRSDPLSPLRVLQALELFGAQARPYNFDDHFDCWGLVLRVFDWLDDGFDMNREAADETTAGNWQEIGRRDELVPGDLLATHPRPDPRYHVVFYCGRVGGRDVVYDSSPRGLIPLFDERGTVVEDRAIHTRYARATETTDRLRDDGGAYLRLWDERMRFFHKGLQARLQAGGAAEERDLVALRRAAGLDGLPFYCRRRLPRDVRGREVYDNLHTRHLDYYVPDGAPVPDDLYEAVMERGERAALADRPAPPLIVAAPGWGVAEGPLVVSWRYPDAAAVSGCRIEVWEETWDLWRRRLERHDRDASLTRFEVSEPSLRPGSRYAVVVYARGAGGYSGSAVAPFLYRPAANDPLLAYNPVRPRALWPDGGAEEPAGSAVELVWEIAAPEQNQVKAAVAVFEDVGCLVEGAEALFTCRLEGVDAAACRCVVPAAALRAGHSYYWYVTPTNAAGHDAFAPAEGVFRVAAKEG